MEERIQKIIASRGLMSRRKAEELIRDGQVRVNGNTAQLGESADPNEDIIEIDGKRLARPPEHLYLMLHKPRGYVTTMSDEKGRSTAFELVQDCGQRVYPVGRLDLNSEGLLLFTNDGEFANRLMHPRHEVNKTYLAWVNHFSPEKLQQLSQMESLEGERIVRPQVRLVNAKGETALLELVIHEGKNRQVRRMCRQAELTVTRLKRIGEGCVRLGDLPLGKWRPLTPEEIEGLMGL
ncbi:MAG: rRNA pseudouridine synthase [Ruminococcaceae bacterium]|nr:rRNA pseudouridine synthase [Oscillospiraceae bacterium]